MSNNKSGLFTRCIELLNQYKNNHQITAAQKYQLDEVLLRLKTELDRYIEIINQNEKLLAKDVSSIRIEMADEEIFSLLTKQAKKDPELDKWLKSTGGKITRRNSTEVSSYNLGAINELEDKKKAKELIGLNEKSESLYRNLWTIKTRLNMLPKFKNFNPVGVRDVRNHLIDHAGRQSNAVIFSFGLSTQGPILRPLKPSGSNAPSDRGMELNVDEFLLAIIKILETI